MKAVIILVVAAALASMAILWKQTISSGKPKKAKNLRHNLEFIGNWQSVDGNLPESFRIEQWGDRGSNKLYVESATTGERHLLIRTGPTDLHYSVDGVPGKILIDGDTGTLVVSLGLNNDKIRHFQRGDTVLHNLRPAIASASSVFIA